MHSVSGQSWFRDTLGWRGPIRRILADDTTSLNHVSPSLESDHRLHNLFLWLRAAVMRDGPDRWSVEHRCGVTIRVAVRSHRRAAWHDGGCLSGEFASEPYHAG